MFHLLFVLPINAMCLTHIIIGVVEGREREGKGKKAKGKKALPPRVLVLKM